MRRRALAELWLGLLLACLAAGGLWLTVSRDTSPGKALTMSEAFYLPSPQARPPANSEPWQATALPVMRPSEASPSPTWFRMSFDLQRQPTAFWGVLLPYLYGGGQVWLDGVRIADIPTSTERVHIRWERPHLVVVPEHLLGVGRHELWVHAAPVAGETSLTFPRPLVGPMSELEPAHDRRMFWVSTVPQLTVAACLVVSAFVLLIWSRLPEPLYGWFGLAALLWGIRTLTFVMEVVPAERWPLWRLVYLAGTGGFIVVMVIFASHLAGLRQRWVERGLLLYWLAGPLWFAWHGVGSDALVNRLWTAGLIPIAIATVVVSFLTAWRQRTAASLLVPSALALATLSGVNDYLVVWKPALVASVAPAWASERYFLLHHGANVLLLSMGMLLTVRFVRAVKSLRELNQTLEQRIAEREKSLADNYLRLAYLERQNAAAEERKLIMREIHDGVGSRLFTSLSRVERGVMDAPQMADSLRACISDMRLALDALAPDDPDLLSAFGDFMFRWQAELDAVGVRCTWDIDVAGDDLHLPPHATLQVLRIAQESLTNVAKHARATQVALLLRHRGGEVTLCIEDDGQGLVNNTASVGRGLGNMRARAEQVGARLEVGPGDAGRGVRVLVTLAC